MRESFVKGLLQKSVPQSKVAVLFRLNVLCWYTSEVCSAGLTIVANVAIGTGPALLGARRSCVINLTYYIIYKNLFSLRRK